VKTAEIQRLARHIAQFQDRFAPLFGRPERRRWAREYVAGLLMDLERKNCWQIAEARKIPPQQVKALQHFLYGSRWLWAPVIEQMARLVDEYLGGPDGIVIVDESGVRRWGEKSVGVGRQYLGTIGKVDNGQVAVYLTYASERGQSFLDTRIYLNKEWLLDRRRAGEAGIPPNTVFRTKPELAAATSPARPIAVCATRVVSSPSVAITPEGAAAALLGPAHRAAIRTVLGEMLMHAIREEERRWGVCAEEGHEQGPAATP